MPYNTILHIFLISQFLLVTFSINNADTNIFLKGFRHWALILQGLIKQRFSGIKSFYRKGKKIKKDVYIKLKVKYLNLLVTNNRNLYNVNMRQKTVFLAKSGTKQTHSAG